MMVARKTHETFVKEVFEKYGDEYTVLGKYTKTHSKILLRHNTCGNEWDTTAPYDFLKPNANKCPKCASNKSWTSSMEELQLDVDRLYTKGEFTLSGKYVNNKTKVTITHTKCGKQHAYRPDLLRQGNYRCGSCYSVTESMVSRNVENTLISLGLEFEKEKSFPWLRYELSLFLDFYLPEYKVAVEADGEQHYIAKRGGDDELIKTMKRDKCKVTLCRENGIQLIRIPSYLPNHQLVPFLTKLLYEADVVDFDEPNELV